MLRYQTCVQNSIAIAIAFSTVHSWLNLLGSPHDKLFYLENDFFLKVYVDTTVELICKCKLWLG